jgi:hypothetical protein
MAKKTSRIELISTVGSLHIGSFLLHMSPFSTGRTGRIVYRKKPLIECIAKSYVCHTFREARLKL